MTIAELIRELEKWSPESRVVVVDPGSLSTRDVTIVQHAPGFMSERDERLTDAIELHGGDILGEPEGGYPRRHKGRA